MCKSKMKYRGYTGVVKYDEDAKIFHGTVVGIKDVITFQGTSVEDLEQSFKDSVDDYVQRRKELEFINREELNQEELECAKMIKERDKEDEISHEEFWKNDV